MDINIEEIMQEIRQEIADKHLTPDMLSFEDVPYTRPDAMNGCGLDSEEARNAMVYLNSHYNVQAYKPLAGNPLFVFVKKVIRKLTKFYVEPVVDDQNTFNANTVRMLNALSQEVEALRKENAELRAALKERR